jgi:OmpA-OmpF porin, OOP family
MNVSHRPLAPVHDLLRGGRAVPQSRPPRVAPVLTGLAGLALAGLLTLAPQHGHASDVIDVGQSVPDAAAVAEGLFPEDACEELKKAGFKCMGFKPAVRYSLPATSFALGSAELPDTLKKQLQVFAEVLRSRRGSGQAVRIEGHADASGPAVLNQQLSLQRAEAVRDYLVSLGTDPALLQPVGLGVSVPRNPKDPFAAENRRVEIGRASPPS